MSLADALRQPEAAILSRAARLVAHARGLARALRLTLLRGVAALLLVSASAQAFDPAQVTLAAKKYGPTAITNTKALLQLMAGLAGKDTATQLKTVNDFYNRRLAYMEDIDNWGLVDYWASPLEGLGKGAGDCEDYAIGKYFTLTSMGMSDSKLRMVYVRASIAGAPNGYVPHMVLAYYAQPDAEPLVLDNLQPDIHPASQRPDLTPVFSFNTESLWQGVGSIRAGGDPMVRLSKWREVTQRARQDGFQ